MGTTCSNVQGDCIRVIEPEPMRPSHADTPFSSHFGEGAFHVFSWGPHEEDNVLAVVAGPPTGHPIVRVQSACYTAEIFRSTDCDCHEQLEISLKRVHAE